MASDHEASAKPTDLDYAIQLILTGKKDEQFARRVQAETEGITQEIRRKHGVLDVAVELIRETRDEAWNMTADQRLIRVLQPAFPFIRSLADLP